MHLLRGYILTFVCRFCDLARIKSVFCHASGWFLNWFRMFSACLRYKKDVKQAGKGIQRLTSLSVLLVMVAMTTLSNSVMSSSSWKFRIFSMLQ